MIPDDCVICGGCGYRGDLCRCGELSNSNKDHRCVSALFVQSGGAYYGLKNVDPWDEARDARKYAGPNPVVAHPPCQRWGEMWAGQPLWIKRTGERKKKGDDKGCFESALNSVRKFGGVLEHPCFSHAWKHFGIKKPPRNGGWIKADEFGGFPCCVEQGNYGHYAPKPTWLYVVGCELPELRWGKRIVKDDDFPPWAMVKYGRKKCRKAGLLAFKGGGKDSSARIHTPSEFRDVLVYIASTANTKQG